MKRNIKSCGNSDRKRYGWDPGKGFHCLRRSKHQRHRSDPVRSGQFFCMVMIIDITESDKQIDQLQKIHRRKSTCHAGSRHA